MFSIWEDFSAEVWAISFKQHAAGSLPTEVAGNFYDKDI